MRHARATFWILPMALGLAACGIDGAAVFNDPPAEDDASNDSAEPPIDAPPGQRDASLRDSRSDAPVDSSPGPHDARTDAPDDANAPPYARCPDAKGAINPGQRACEVA